MASIYDIKPAFQRVLRPLMERLAQAGITPNQLTLSALGLSVLWGVLLVLNVYAEGMHWVLWGMPLVLLLRMALNALDGMLARSKNMSTPLGEVLNELGDVLADIALYLPLMFYVLPSWGAYAVIGFVILTVVSEFCGLLAKSIMGERRYDGPMGKSDRAFAVSLYCLLLFFQVKFIISFSGIWFVIMDLLLIISCINRIRPCIRKTS